MWRVFMSAYRADRTEAQNRRMHGLLMQRLLLMFSGPEIVLGQYKGVPEVSITFGMSAETQPKVVALLKEFEQECALVVGGDGFAEFLFPDGKRLPLMGYLQQVQEYPEGQDYSFWRGAWWVLHNETRVQQ